MDFTNLPEYLDGLNLIRNKLKGYAISRELSIMAAQVSHDIRSPLAALEMISGGLGELPEEKRLILRNAINRIRDIANSLRMKNEMQIFASESSTESEQLMFEVVLISQLVENIVTEKRLEFRNSLTTEINFNQEQESYGLFASVNSIEFKRVISNLVNNAVESHKRDSVAKVDVRLFVNVKNEVVITVSDQGRGMAPELLAKVGQRGFTHGKPDGSGLGLHHAKETVKFWHGDLSISSKVEEGTTITITLPRQEPPKWFVPNLKIHQNTRVIVFDDDQSIHSIWEGRLSSSVPESYGLELIHFTNAFDLRKYYGRNFTDLDKAIFLMDYELQGQEESGLDLIEELGIQSQSILVTSRYEETNVRSRCERLGVPLIPKSMSGFVPIKLG